MLSHDSIASALPATPMSQKLPTPVDPTPQYASWPVSASRMPEYGSQVVPPRASPQETISRIPRRLKPKAGMYIENGIDPTKPETGCPNLLALARQLFLALLIGRLDFHQDVVLPDGPKDTDKQLLRTDYSVELEHIRIRPTRIELQHSVDSLAGNVGADWIELSRSVVASVGMRAFLIDWTHGFHTDWNTVAQVSPAYNGSDMSDLQRRCFQACWTTPF